MAGLATTSLELVLQYLPLVLGAYISVAILRFPDLTIEASWSLGGVLACSLAGSIGAVAAPFAGLVMGAACGVMVSVFFFLSGRVKLLAGLLAFLVLQAAGARIIGGEASIFLSDKLARFGFGQRSVAPWILYVLVDAALLILLVAWQYGRVGIRARLLGDKPYSSVYLGFSDVGSYVGCLVLSNSLVGLGGGLWAVYYGQASNLQGIGMVLIAFFALLLGDETLRAVSKVLPFLRERIKRETPVACLVGTFLFVCIYQIAGRLLVKLTLLGIPISSRATDRDFFVAAAVLYLLWARERSPDSRMRVSTW